MITLLRILVVDPCDESRQPLLDLIQSLGPGILVEDAASYSIDLRCPGSLPPEIVVVVLDTATDTALELTQRLTAEWPGSAIVVATTSRDAELMVRVFRFGAKECLLLPVPRMEIATVLDRLARRLLDYGTRGSHKAAKTIAVVGATGGVGCTSLALNLAMAIKRLGTPEVALADLDFVTGLIGPWLELQFDTTLAELTRIVDRLDSLLLRRAMVAHQPTGIYVLPGLDAIAEAPLIPPEALAQLITLLKRTFEAVVIDIGKGLHTTDLLALQAADTILLLTQLEVLSLNSTLRLLKLLRSLDSIGDKVEIVLNRVGSGTSEVRIKKVEETLGLPIRWQIPNAYRAFHSSRLRGEPLSGESDGDKALQAIEDLARALHPDRIPVVNMATGEPGEGRWSGWWFGRNGRRKSVAIA